MLIIFEILLFGVVDLMAENYVLSAVILYIIMEVGEIQIKLFADEIEIDLFVDQRPGDKLTEWVKKPWSWSVDDIDISQEKREKKTCFAVAFTWCE